MDELKNLKILIVDNDDSIATILKMLMSSKGLAIEVALNGDEGLAVLQEKKIDIALIDINLGEASISGFELIKKYKSLVPANTVKFIAMSGYRYYDIEDQLKDAGFDDYLAKPFKLDEVILKIQNT